MKNGLRVYDSDTHVMPGAEVIERHVDPEFRPRLAEVAQYRVPVRQSAEHSGGAHTYRVAQQYYRRILGEAGPREGHTGRDSNWRGSRLPRPGVQDAAADNRVQDMDDEGTDVHFLVPSGWTGLIGVDDPTLESGMIRAFHRHMAEFCGRYPDRLKGPIIASTRDVEGAVQEIKTWGKANWAAAVKPQIYKIPADHPSLDPIWQAAADHDLPIVHHSSTWNPPYYPGHNDLWDNIFLGRLASHPWGAMRFVAAFIGGGILDRYPSLRFGTLECGFGWLPFWGKRMDEQYAYVGSTQQLKMKPSEYLSSGRYFCSIEHQEGEDMYHHVAGFLGDGALMYASDYPHSECQFPESIDNILAWQSLSGEQRKKLLWDNATRFFRQA
jgi:predicted TIM-barrel fold metal-dependent hydrolase